MKSNQKSANRKLLAFSFLIAFAFLAICDMSSPLYPLNDWVDVNCFFTVGRAMKHGLVPYRDLYEQKGPLLYMLYAIAALISERSYLGPYLLDSICFGLFLYFTGRLIQQHLGNRKIVYFLLLVLAVPVVTSRAFSHGGSVELLCLWLFAYPLFAVDRAIGEKRPLKGIEAFYIGLCAAGSLYIKFTMLGFFLGLALFVLLWYLVFTKNRKKLPQVIGCFLGGIAALSAPIFLYFLVNGSIKDMFTVYFHNNLFLYPTESANRLSTIAACLKYAIRWNRSLFLLVGLSFLWFPFVALRRKRGLFTAWALCLLGLTVGTYWGGRSYLYYALVFAAFAGYGLIGIAELLDWCRSKIKALRNLHWNPLVPRVLLGIATAVALVISLKCNKNTYIMDYAKEDTPQYRFAAEIQETENATLLNYGFLDGGFYYAAGIVPTCKFFCYLNIPLPELWPTMTQCITDGQVDYVVTRNRPLEEYVIDSSLYYLVDTATMPFNGNDYTYYLYRRMG